MEKMSKQCTECKRPLFKDSEKARGLCMICFDKKYEVLCGKEGEGIIQVTKGK